MLGCDATQFEGVAQATLQSISKKPPAFAALKNLLILNQPDLIRHRTEYEVAERELRLEIARQYPDITFGAEREKEVGEKTVIFGSERISEISSVV